MGAIKKKKKNFKYILSRYLVHLWYMLKMNDSQHQRQIFKEYSFNRTNLNTNFWCPTKQIYK